MCWIPWLQQVLSATGWTCHSQDLKHSLWTSQWPAQATCEHGSAYRRINNWYPWSTLIWYVYMKTYRCNIPDDKLNQYIYLSIYLPIFCKLLHHTSVQGPGNVHTLQTNQYSNPGCIPEANENEDDGLHFSEQEAGTVPTPHALHYRDLHTRERTSYSCLKGYCINADL